MNRTSKNGQQIKCPLVQDNNYIRGYRYAEEKIHQNKDSGKQKFFNYIWKVKHIVKQRRYMDWNESRSRNSLNGIGKSTLCLVKAIPSIILPATRLFQIPQKQTLMHALGAEIISAPREGGMLGDAEKAADHSHHRNRSRKRFLGEGSKS